VLFDGAPVKAALGIDAGFGGEGMQRFVELVSTVTADRAGKLGDRGPLPAGPRLFITDVEVGSFGFQVAELADPDLFAKPSPLKEALDETTRLLNAAGRSDDALAESLSARSPRVLGKLRDLLETVCAADASLKVDTGSVQSLLDTVEAVRGARDRAAAMTLTEETHTGILYVFLGDPNFFELRTDGGALLSGPIDRAMEPATLAARFNQPVRATLRKVTAGRAGRTRTAFVLLSVTDVAG